MRKLPTPSRLLLLLLSLLLAPAPSRAQSQASPAQNEHGSAPTQEPFPGVTASPATEPFPGVTASSVNTSPLSAVPYVYALKHRDPGEMSPADSALVRSLGPEVKAKAALMSFDLSSMGWSYQQIVCPALPDYLLLSFRHGPDPSGSSRFTAALERDGTQVRIISTYAHGMRPFTSAWAKRSTFEIFNQMLRQERGMDSLAVAPNWLVIGLCYAELSGYQVQALTSKPEPGPTLDLLRLNGNLPQLEISPNRSAEITFSDVSKPAVTTRWMLRFDRHGQLVAAQRASMRQPARAALRP